MAWVAAYRLRFSDGGEDEFGVLHEGTEEDCGWVLDNTHAVTYGGGRPVAETTAFMVETD